MRSRLAAAGLVPAGLVPAVLVTAALVAAGCSSVQTLDVPAPPATAAAATTSTTAAVPSTVAESRVDGSTPSSSVAIRPGSARINGTVLGPAGPVEGATVEVRRYVGDADSTIQATTAADGSFDVPGIRGGRYVVRAWRAPSLAESSSQSFFLSASGTRTLGIDLTAYSGLEVATALNPEMPLVGQPVNLAIEVTQATVGDDGDVTQVPQVSVTVRLESTNFVPFGGGPTIATTGLDGRAILGITCTEPGPAPITLLVGGAKTVSVDTAFCVAPPTTTTSTTSTTTTTLPPTTPPALTTTLGPTTTLAPPTPTTTVATPPPSAPPSTARPTTTAK